MSLKTIKNNLDTIITICLIIGMVVGGLAFFAKASDLKALEQRVDYRFLSEQIENTQGRVWKLEDRYNINVPGFDPIPMPQDIKDQHRELKAKLEDLIRQQKAMLEK